MAMVGAMPALEARAGQWELLKPPDIPAQSDTNAYNAYMTQWGEFFSGALTKKESGAPNGGTLYYPNPYVTTPSTIALIVAGQRQMIRDQAHGTGGAAELKLDGKVRYQLRWQRRTTNGVPDATDNPPPYVYLVLKGDAVVTASDANGSSGARQSSNESAAASISVEGTTQELYANDTAQAAQNTGAYTRASASLNHVIKVDVGNSDQIWTPWIAVDAHGELTDNRTYSEGYPGYPQYTRTFWSDGNVSMEGTSWDTSIVNLTLTPSPDNLALDDGTGKGLNQYTIEAGIPTSISVTSSDTGFTESLRANSTWNLVGNAPALRPLLANVKDENYGTALIRPQHPAYAAGGTPVYGLKFNIQTKDAPANTTDTTADYDWRFPADNTQFGVKTLNHLINGLTMPAPVGLFFPSNGHQHPRGGPEGYIYDNGYAGVGPYVAPPNWVYYYDNEWKNPWGFTVGYWQSQYNGSYSFGGPARIYIGDDAHAAMTPENSPNFNSRPTYIYAIPPATSANPHPYAARVGEQYVRGLDVYVRVVTHESAHILMRKAIENGAIDSDGDRCPDDIERAAGLNPIDPDTTIWGGNYATYGDGETIATMYEKDLLAPTENDWADDGFNWKAFQNTPPNRVQRTVSVTYPAFQGMESQLTYPDPHADLTALLPQDLRAKTPPP